jgi:hypothetical protein
MKNHLTTCCLLLIVAALAPFSDCFAQSRGLRTITEEELRYNLEFLGAREFRGRETPSPELDIATLYVANWARDAGLKSLMPDGSFYQPVPLTVTSVFQPGTRIVLSDGTGNRTWYFGREMGGNFSASGSYSGEVVFTAINIADPVRGWSEQDNPDVRNKVIVILDAMPAGSEPPTGRAYFSRLNRAISFLRSKGASAVLSVISPEREEKLHSGFNVFDVLPSGRLGILYDSQKTDFSSSGTGPSNRQASAPFEHAEISHEVAAAILGVTMKDISDMFSAVEDGRKLGSRVMEDRRVRLDVQVETRKGFSRNVIAMVEGSDPVLKNEYVVICGHPDGLGLREGEVLPGADDNCTATVALIGIGKALMAERPKRSVILAWFTGEEKMMNGSHYFINNCPVPPEKITACLNMDMIGRNATDSLFLICSDLLSSELDASIKKVNKKSGIDFLLDYTYSDINHPEHVYFRSDHYPFVRFGIPSVWFFSGFTPDYHTPRDGTESINYRKFFRITRLVYLTAFDIGNMRDMLKLDVNPEVTRRGSENLRIPSLYRYSGM